MLLPEPGQPNISFPGQATYTHTQEGDGKFLPASPPLAYPPGGKCPCTALINSPGIVCNRHQERMVRPSPHFQPPWTLPTPVQAGPAGQGGKEGGISSVRLFVTPWTAAHQAHPSMGFPRQEYWSGVPLPSPCSVGFSAIPHSWQVREQPWKLCGPCSCLSHEDAGRDHHSFIPRMCCCSRCWGTAVNETRKNPISRQNLLWELNSLTGFLMERT